MAFAMINPLLSLWQALSFDGTGSGSRYDKPMEYTTTGSNQNEDIIYPASGFLLTQKVV